MINDEQLFEISVDYYLKGKSQKEIAERLKVSHVQVGKYLKLARSKGIVEISINPPVISEEERDKHLSILSKLFGLKNLVLVPSARSEEISCSFLVEGTVKYILANFPEKLPLHIAIGEGRTMQELSCYPIKTAEKRTNWKYMPVMNYDSSLGSSHLYDYKKIIDNIVKNWGGSVDRNVRAALASGGPGLSEKCKAELDYFRSHIDLLIGGVGIPFTRDPIARKAMFGTDVPVTIAGDYLNYYFDIDGNIHTPLNLGWNAFSMEEIKKARSILAVASGYQKVISIISLLKCGIVDTLVTDINTITLVTGECMR